MMFSARSVSHFVSTLLSTALISTMLTAAQAAKDHSHKTSGVSHMDGPAAGAAGEPHAITMINSCKQTIWPAMYTSNGNAPSPPATGWEMAPGASYVINVPTGWNGRFWARTGCFFGNPDTKSCESGSCIGGLQCTQPGIPPVTLVEFQMDKPTDWYDVSNVDGSNLPVVVTPSEADCTVASCSYDLNLNCPADLQFKDSEGGVVGCKSPCLAYGTPETCCSGNFATPEACPAPAGTNYFKSHCPNAYSYAYDDKTSLYNCKSANYKIEWCGN